MARHNFLVQKHQAGDNTGNPSTGIQSDWRDCGPFHKKHTRDEYGNAGFATIEEARENVAYARLNNPTTTYRIIQIIS